MLSKKLGVYQWLSLVILMTGVAFVQVNVNRWFVFLYCPYARSRDFYTNHTAFWFYQLHTSTRVRPEAMNHNWAGLEDTRHGSKADDNTSFVFRCSAVERGAVIAVFIITHLPTSCIHRSSVPAQSCCSPCDTVSVWQIYLNFYKRQTWPSFCIVQLPELVVLVGVRGHGIRDYSMNF